MNKFISAMSENANLTYTENGAPTRTTTMNMLMDMFALGAAYRFRSEEDCILLFKNAYEENPLYALKCLFYLRDVRGGQGERRFFRICMNWLAKYDVEAARRNMELIPTYGRWDDLYCLVDTPLEGTMFAFVRKQLNLDIQCKTPSLLAKWLKSENTSSKESRELGNRTREALKMSHKQYRKVLSTLRERINVLERLMSAGKWSEIEFDKIPSKAGLIYRNAFARHDIERMKQNPEAVSYETFAKDTTTKVNADALYPYECVDKANYCYNHDLEDTERLMVNKYWDNLHDYFQNATFNGMCVVDVSGSMFGSGAAAPINIAISLGLYCADKAKGPYAGHFITFSSKPEFVKVEGVDFCDKVRRMQNANWGMSTNVEAAFDLMLDVAIQNNLAQEDIPENLLIVSDMEFNSCWTSTAYMDDSDTLFEAMAKKWVTAGYKMPKLVFWNVNARNDRIPMRDDGYITYVSGASASTFEMLMEGKSGLDFVMAKLDSERYAPIC